MRWSNHNPMEMFATTVVYEKGRNKSGGKYMVYDKTQGVTNSILYAAQVFDIPFKDIRVSLPTWGAALAQDYGHSISCLWR